MVVRAAGAANSTKPRQTYNNDEAIQIKIVMTTRDDHLRLFSINKSKVLAGPRTVLLHLTDACNLRCLHCWYHSSLDTQAPRASKELGFDAIRKTLDDCHELRVEEIRLSGKGEPTLHSRFPEIVSYASQKKFKLHLFTNATFPPDWIKLIRHFEVLNIDLSAATEKQYLTLQSRGPGDHFKTVCRNLRLLAYLKKQKKKMPRLKLIYVLNALNYREIPKIFEIAGKMAIEELFVKNIDTRRYNTSLRLTPEIASKTESIIKKISGKKAFLGIDNNLKHNFKARGTYLDELFMRPTQPAACYMTWYYVFVTSLGHITPCCQMQHTCIMGNIYRDSLKDVWRSRKFQRLRLRGSRSLFDHAIHECRSCCHYRENDAIARQLRTIENDTAGKIMP